MEIAQPKRILLVAPSGTSSHPVLNALTQSQTSEAHTKNADPSPAQPPASQSLSSDVPVHRIENSYYRASIPIWTDEVLSSVAWAEQWKAEDGAADVIRAVGAWIVCFHKPVTDVDKSALTNLLSSISSVINHHTSTTSSAYSYDTNTDAVLLAVAVPHSTPTTVSSTPDVGPKDISHDAESDLDLDDLCREAGNWEYVNVTLPPASLQSRTDATGSQHLDDYGETMGMERLLEALQGGEWDVEDDGVDVDDDDEREMSHIFEGDAWDAGIEEEGFDGDETATGGQDLFRGDLAAQLATLTGSEEGTRKPAGVENEHLAGMREALLGVKTGDAGDESQTKTRAGADTGDTAQEYGDQDEDETWRVKPRRAKGGTQFGTQFGLADGETDDDVEALQAMMLKLQATRDLGADLPMAERRKIARAAVQKVMKEMA